MALTRASTGSTCESVHAGSRPNVTPVVVCRVASAPSTVTADSGTAVVSAPLVMSHCLASRIPEGAQGYGCRMDSRSIEVGLVTDPGLAEDVGASLAEPLADALQQQVSGEVHWRVHHRSHPLA